MKITIHLHNGITFLLLAVPLNTSDFKIVSKDGNFLSYKTINGYTDWMDIPFCNYTIIGKADALTEGQAKEIGQVDLAKNGLQPETTLILKQST